MARMQKQRSKSEFNREAQKKTTPPLLYLDSRLTDLTLCSTPNRKSFELDRILIYPPSGTDHGIFMSCCMSTDFDQIDLVSGRE
ncbi:hypothetical protein CEXT_286191 [Caerostris extrusa]|uniref:Uncharacterized protein n=1 Tax=Caerostris extrusa TaxID=172846 RepID=A0AAV4VLV9_CAEEX|nr:hypothetical protein CEXT_286191 [Caerostris extrusa]